MHKDPGSPASRFRVSPSPVLLVLLLLAVVIRVVFWVQTRDLPLADHPTGDSATYVALAGAIERDGPLAPRGEAYQRGPLYPLFLAGLGAAGLGVQGVRITQFVLGVLGVGFLWILGRRLAGRTGAILGALGGAVTGPLVFFEGELLSISLAVFLLEASLVLVERSRLALSAGLLFGLASLAQPNLLLAGLIFGILQLLPALSRSGRRGPVLFLVGLGLLPLLTLGRNLSESGEPVLIAGNGGINFFIGNNPGATGTFHLPAGTGLLNRPEGLFTSAREIAEQDRGEDLTPLEVDRYWWGRGLDYWRRSPLEAAGLTGRKVLLALNDHESPNLHDYETFRSRVPVLRYLPTLGWVLPLGILGAMLALKRKPSWPAPLLLALVASVVIFFVTARYRLPIFIPLWPAAGVLVRDTLQRRFSTRRLALLGGIGVSLAVLAFWPLTDRGEARSHMANLEGLLLFEQGRTEEAAAAFEEAVRTDPAHAEALNNLGRLRQMSGNVAEALEYYERALAARPEQAETYFNLEELYRNAGDPGAALEILDRLESARGGRVDDVAGDILYRRGFNTLTLGDTTRAMAYLEASVRRDPTLDGAWQTLGYLYRTRGRMEEAETAYRRAAAAREDR